MVAGAAGRNWGHMGFSASLILWSFYVMFDHSWSLKRPSPTWCCRGRVPWRSIEPAFFLVLGVVLLLGHLPLVARGSACAASMECYARNVNHVMVGAFYIVCALCAQLRRGCHPSKCRAHCSGRDLAAADASGPDWAIPAMAVLSGYLMTHHAPVMSPGESEQDIMEDMAEGMVHALAGWLMVAAGLARAAADRWPNVTPLYALGLMWVACIWGAASPMILIPAVAGWIDGMALIYGAMIVALILFAPAAAALFPAPSPSDPAPEPADAEMGVSPPETAPLSSSS